MENVPPALLHACASSADKRWQRAAATMLATKLSDTTYPCHFATLALRRDQLRVGFIRLGDSESAAALLHAYLESVENKAGSREAFAIIEEAGPQVDHRTYFDRFWRYLIEMHDHDVRGWPSDRPTDPNSPHWMYVFRETPFFVFGLSPSHQVTSSRHLPNHLALVFVPQNSFAGIERGTLEGARVRERIAQRLAAYEQAPPHPCLDQSDQRIPAWKAYFLVHDDCPQGCPFHVHRLRHRGRLFVSGGE